MQLCFLLFSQPIIIRKITSGGVLELSGSPLDYEHRDFENWCRYGRENCCWSSHFYNRNLCAHDQEEILTIPKHPQKSSFWWFLAEKTAKNEVAPKIEYQNNFRKTLSSLEPHNLASNSPNWASWGCFGIVKISSKRWAQRLFKWMHPRLSNTLKTILINYGANCRCSKQIIERSTLYTTASPPQYRCGVPGQSFLYIHYSRFKMLRTWRITHGELIGTG